MVSGYTLPTTVFTSSIENLSVTAMGAGTKTTVDTSGAGFADVTSVSITANSTGTSGNNPGVLATAAATQAVTISDAAGAVVLAGGLNQTVTGNGLITLTGSVGAVSVTDAAQGSGQIHVDGGTSVNITSTSSNPNPPVGTTGTITVGNALAPTGPVKISSTISEVAGATTAGGTIAVTGGTTVSVTQAAVMAVDPLNTGFNGTITNAAVTVTGTLTTTSVTATASAIRPAAPTVLAVAAITEVETLTFGTLADTKTFALNGLTFTNTSGATLTSPQVAAAFANLAAGAAQGNSTKGVYSGAFNTEGWTSGAVVGAVTGTLTMTATAAAARTNFTAGGSIASVSLVTDNGIAAGKASGNTGVVANDVTVTDVNAGSTTLAGTITSVTASNYVNLSINDNALTTLNVTGGSGNITIANGGLSTPTNKTLNLTVDGLTGGILDDANIYTTLNVTTKYTGTSTTATSSTLTDITDTALTALNVSGDKVLILASQATSAAGMPALKTVTVTGSAGLTATANGGLTLATAGSVDASGTSGANTITLNTTVATYAGGSGVDKLTTAAGVSKAISLGDGNDTLTLALGTAAVTAAASGGNGFDTLSMVAADANSTTGASANTLFAGLVTSFEVLNLTGGTGAQGVAVDTLGSYHSVTTGGEAIGGVLTMSGFASGDTLTLLTSSLGGYAVSGVGTAWTTPTTDSFNIVLSSGGSIQAGTVTADKVETLNITATDTDTATSANADTLTVAGNTATSIVVTGNSALTLTSTAALVKTVNASAMTAGFTFTASGTAAQTVTGSATAANVLTAHTGATADVLIGGAGNDTLTANAGLSSMTGGAGKDTFVVATPSANANVYSTITDASSGDTIKLADQGLETFAATKLSLSDTATFVDYLDLAASGDVTTTGGVISWFQFAGNTYLVEDLAPIATPDNAVFTAGEDIVVKLTGLIDLSTASLNTGTGPTLLLA